MEHVVLVIHLILTLALIGLILIQKSEGGGLGLGGGGGGGMGSFASAQSTKNAITKTTTIVAICFFATSLILAIMAANTDRAKSILDSVPTTAVETTVPTAPTPPINGATPTPSAPATTTTPTPSTPAPATAPKVPLGQ